MLRRITSRPGRVAGALVACIATALSVTAVASAATPTVTTGAATSITQTTAVLHGHVNPHGVATDFAFDYGPTVAYGGVSLAHNAGAGTKPQLVSETVTGLLPGTVYHFRITAVTASGTIYGADATFKTTGSPPSSVATGPPSAVGKTQATPTGSINPNGSSTTWLIQYGLTASYGIQTFTQTAIAPGFTAVPVSLPLTGLAPATLFHYRIVAFHGSVATDGADATFFTEPDRAPSPNMTATTKPGSDSKAPYRFTTSGRLRGGTYIPAANRCTGTVGIRYFNGRHQVASAVAGVSASCTYSAKVSFRRTHGSGSVALRVVVYHRANGYLAGQTKTNHIRAGK